MNILLVKISSMGDLIQALPAITDARRAIPTLQVDWVADSAFIDVPSWHPAVRRVIEMSHRRWKKQPLAAKNRQQIKHFYRQLRAQSYDYVMDAQSNLKSALVTRLANGKRVGMDAKSIHEWGAQFAYQHRCFVPKAQSHVERIRQLFAQALDYQYDVDDLDYGIELAKLPQLNFDLPKRFIFLANSASRAYRHWPTPHWRAWLNAFAKRDAKMVMVIPWHSQAEKQAADRLKQSLENPKQLHVLPQLSLSEKARVLSQAVAAVSINTGLAHLAAALSIPNISLYGPTSPKLVGTVGNHQQHLTATAPTCAPCERSQCHYQHPPGVEFPACMASITPQSVLDAIFSLRSSV